MGRHLPGKAGACGKFPDKETAHHPNTPNDQTDDLQDGGTVDQNGEWIRYPSTIRTTPECCREWFWVMEL